MSAIDFNEKKEAVAKISQDAIEHLVWDISQYDRHYEKYAAKKRGRMALRMAQSAGYFEAVLGSALDRFDEEGQLFEDLEAQEKTDAMTKFTSHIGRIYIGWLFDGTRHRDRPYSKAIFPYPDGNPRTASVYVDMVWAERYATEFVEAQNAFISVTEELQT